MDEQDESKRERDVARAVVSSFAQTSEASLVCPKCEGTGVVVRWNFVASPPNGYKAKQEFGPCPLCSMGRTVRA